MLPTLRRCVRYFIALVNIWLIVLNLWWFVVTLRNSLKLFGNFNVNDAIVARTQPPLIKMLLTGISSPFDLVDDLRIK